MSLIITLAMTNNNAPAQSQPPMANWYSGVLKYVASPYNTNSLPNHAPLKALANAATVILHSTESSPCLGYPSRRVRRS